MSDFYNLSIIIPVHTKNTVYLCKQATGQIDGAMIAFPGCKFVSSHLFGEFPGEPEGKTALNQAGFFLRASLRFLLPRDCKGGVCALMTTLHFLTVPLVTFLGNAWALLLSLLMMISALSIPASSQAPDAWGLVPDFGQCCLGSPIPPSDVVPDEGHLLGLSGATCPGCISGGESVRLAPLGLPPGSLPLLFPGTEAHGSCF